MVVADPARCGAQARGLPLRARSEAGASAPQGWRCASLTFTYDQRGALSFGDMRRLAFGAFLMAIKN